MPTCHASAKPTCVLAVLPAPRFTGLAVLDGTGIVPGGFASWNLRSAKTNEERILLLRRRLIAALSRFRPTVVVIGIPNRKTATFAEMRKTLEDVALANRIPVVHRFVTESRKLVLGRPGGSAKNALAQQLVCGFFPRLAMWRKGANSSRYRCHAFSALALGLHELGLRAPLSAATISTAEAFGMDAWTAFLAERARNLYPQENL
jgi:hypothetical protein